MYYSWHILYYVLFALVISKTQRPTPVECLSLSMAPHGAPFANIHNKHVQFHKDTLITCIHQTRPTAVFIR